MGEMGKDQKVYSVGYKKPPQNTQFRPGQSGNPKGRPKKVPTISEVFSKELRSRVLITMRDGKRIKTSLLRAIVKQFTNKAAKGDYKAAKLVLEQLATGKPESGDNLANLLQEFRVQHARNEAGDADRPADADDKPKKRT